MKIVLDMNLSPAWVPFLETKGHIVKHWSEIGAITALIRKIWNGHEATVILYSRMI